MIQYKYKYLVKHSTFNFLVIMMVSEPIQKVLLL